MKTWEVRVKGFENAPPYTVNAETEIGAKLDTILGLVVDRGLTLTQAMKATAANLKPDYSDRKVGG